MNELIKTEEFAEYYQRTIQTCLQYLTPRLFGDVVDLTELRGAIELARRVIFLPVEIQNNDLTKRLVHEGLKRFEARFVLSRLEEKD